MNQTAIAEIRGVIREIYTKGSFFQQLLSIGRPSICPFHTLIAQVPPGVSILDVGCESGIFVNLLAHQKRISHGIGFDASTQAIALARSALKEIKTPANIEFQHRAVEAGLPEGDFGVVSMIDVLHHINPKAQRAAVEQAAAKVAPGGIFLFKDIGRKPRWRAWANRLHDLVLARQWINYVAADDVAAWVEKGGFELTHEETINMFWYGHELLVFRRKKRA